MSMKGECTNIKASDAQIGGSHYKDMPFQPVELFAKTRCTAFQANIWKYITRYKHKNGAEDVRKCMHYAQLALELRCGGCLGPTERAHVNLFCDINGLSDSQSKIAKYASFDNYTGVVEECAKLLKEEYPQGV